VVDIDTIVQDDMGRQYC